jgi:23S rRNA pseudouridine1911/1915/1917 synthase
MHYFRSVPFTFRAITRLDRDTSGVILLAKNIVSADRLSKSLIKNEIEKEYVALSVGTPSPKTGRISAPIKREKEGIIKRCIAPDGKPAVTDYEVIFEKDGLSLVRLFPKTGRTHQLRLHLAHIGTPIYSDFLYGEEIDGERTRLHCRCLTFPHPFSGEMMKIEAPLPDDMKL